MIKERKITKRKDLPDPLFLMKKLKKPGDIERIKISLHEAKQYFGDMELLDEMKLRVSQAKCKSLVVQLYRISANVLLIFFLLKTLSYE